jgi:hypothetical protein
MLEPILGYIPNVGLFYCMASNHAVKGIYERQKMKWKIACFILILCLLLCSTLSPAKLRADINGDCRVDLSDLAIMMSEWLQEENCNMSLSDNLIAHYKMNDNAASTVVLDSKGFSNGTSSVNTSYITFPGKINGSLWFDGASCFINTNSNFKTTFEDSMTLSVWVNIDALGEFDQCIFGAATTALSQPWVRLALKGGKLQFLYLDSLDWPIEANAPALFDKYGEWVHLVVVLVKLNTESGKILLYQDGVLLVETSGSHTHISDFTSINFYIGATNYNGDAHEFFAGSLDNVMIFNKALSPEEISFLWNDGAGTEDVSGYTEPVGGISSEMFNFDEDQW